MKLLIYLIIIFTINLSSLAQFQDFGKNMEQWAEAFEKTVEEYSEAYNEALEEYSEAYNEALEEYSEAYNESMDSYSDAYNESMDSWEDSFKPVIPYKLDEEMMPFGMSFNDSFNRLSAIGKISDIVTENFDTDGWDTDLNDEDTFNGISKILHHTSGFLEPRKRNSFFDEYGLCASVKSKEIYEFGAWNNEATIVEVKKILKILQNKYGDPIRPDQDMLLKNLPDSVEELDIDAIWFVKDSNKNYFEIWFSCITCEMSIYYTRVKESHFNTDDPNKYFTDALINESEEFETDKLFEGQSIDEVSIGL